MSVVGTLRGETPQQVRSLVSNALSPDNHGDAGLERGVWGMGGDQNHWTLQSSDGAEIWQNDTVCPSRNGFSVFFQVKTDR